MFTKLIARLLNKKLYKSQIIIVEDDFTADYYSDSLLHSLKWTLHGIYETNATQQISSSKSSSATNGIFGQISEFKVLNFTKSSIGFCNYAKPKSSDTMFMTNQMVYILKRY